MRVLRIDFRPGWAALGLRGGRPLGQQASLTRRPRRRSTGARSSRQRWRMSSATGSRRPTLRAMMLAHGQEPRCQGYRRKFVLHSRGVNVRVADIVQRWDEMVRVSLGVRRGDPRRARWFDVRPRNHRRRSPAITMRTGIPRTADQESPRAPARGGRSESRPQPGSSASPWSTVTRNSPLCRSPTDRHLRPSKASSRRRHP